METQTHFTRDPRTKEELLDRILRYDFTGDIRQIGAETATLNRLGPNRLELVFPRSNVRFELTVHRPRVEREVEARSFATRDQPPAQHEERWEA